MQSGGKKEGEGWRSWAERRGYEALAVAEAEEPFRVVVRVTGPGAYAYLSGEAGLHRRIEEEKRQRAYVRVHRGGPEDAQTRLDVEGREVPLPTLEFRLMEHLLARVGRVQTREQLLEEVWGMSSHLETRTIDTHILRLRDKLGPARGYLETVRGVGYRLAIPDTV